MKIQGDSILIEREGELEALLALSALTVDSTYNIFQDKDDNIKFLGKFIRRGTVVEGDKTMFRGDLIMETPAKTLTAKIEMYEES